MLLYRSGNAARFFDKQKLLKRVEKSTDFDFKRQTTYGLGGRAEEAFYPKNIPETEAVYDYLSGSGREFLILGNGSNVLASDSGFKGAVISTKRLKGIYRFGENTLFCLAGTTVGVLLKYCLDNGCGGLEYLYGIPATVGALAFMNGGAGGIYINSNVMAVKFYNGKINNFSNKKCCFGNKQSTMRNIKGIILGVFLSFLPDLRQNIEERLSYYKLRRSHLPSGRSCGCVFKNTGEIPSGKLIEDAGLKGARIGGAVVSTSHANFIINDGGTAQDVKSLIDLVKRTVKEKFKIALQEEVVYIGEFNDFNS